MSDMQLETYLLIRTLARKVEQAEAQAKAYHDELVSVRDARNRNAQAKIMLMIENEELGQQLAAAAHEREALMDAGRESLRLVRLLVMKHGYGETAADDMRRAHTALAAAKELVGFRAWYQFSFAQDIEVE